MSKELGWVKMIKTNFYVVVLCRTHMCTVAGNTVHIVMCTVAVVYFLGKIRLTDAMRGIIADNLYFH